MRPRAPTTPQVSGQQERQETIKMPPSNRDRTPVLGTGGWVQLCKQGCSQTPFESALCLSPSVPLTISEQPWGVCVGGS